MVAARTPTLAEIKNSASEADARALLYIAVCEVCDFFNVGKNMNDTQIAITVDLIIENYWYLKLAEIKYCFRRAMCREKLYDRLDGSIILGWLKDYDAERTDAAIRISDQEASQIQYEHKADKDAVSWGTYVESLWNLALYADARAVELLTEIQNAQATRILPLSAEEKKQKDIDFRKWFYNEYVKKKDKSTY